MTPTALLRQTAARYQLAVERVLASWSPECGCQRPGARLDCEACSCLLMFEQRIRDEITRQQSSNGSKFTHLASNSP